MSNNAEPTQSETTPPSVTLSQQQIIMLCAVGLLVCFFLPWIKFMVPISGFDMAKEGDRHLLFWLIPVFSGLTLFAVFTKRSPKIIAQLTGALPFVALVYGYTNIGKDLLQMLTFGGYLSLILGLALFILPRRLK